MSIEVPLLTRENEVYDVLLDSIKAAGTGDGPVRVLEAGCGHHWALTPAGVTLHITGVDADADALRIRREQHGDLDAEIHGDLRTVDIPPGAFDAVYCSYVLEHVEGAELVLARLRNALRPGGRLIVRVPDGDSVYGFLTKHSPHRVHVWYKRYVQKKPHAGEPGHSPYPTVYEPVISVRGFRAWAQRNDMDVVVEYGTNFYLDVLGPLRPVASVVIRAIAGLSRGRLSGRHNNIAFVMVKRGG